jgi:hypothetical protein
MGLFKRKPQPIPSSRNSVPDVNRAYGSYAAAVGHAGGGVCCTVG